MANNYSKHITIYQNNPSIVKLLTVFFLIAKKLKACILSPVPASTQRTSTFNLSKCFIMALLLLVMGVGSVSGTIYTSVNSGNWSATATWDHGIPNNSTGNSVVIANGTTVTLSSATTWGQALTVNSGGTLDLNGYTLSTPNPFTLNGTGVSGVGALINSSGTAVSFAGNIATGTTYSVGGNGDITLTGDVQGTLTKTGNNKLTLGGTQDNSGLGVVATSGTIILAKTSSSSPNVHAIGGGGLTINGGNVQLGGTGGDQIYDGNSPTTTVTITSGGTLDMNGQIESIDVLTGTGGTITNNGGGTSTLTFGVGNSTNSTYSGIIANGSGVISIVKTGTGTSTLSGLNTYSGSTTVNGGILKAGVAAQSFGINSAVTLANMAGVGLDITGFNTTIGSLTGGGATGGSVTLGAATLTIGSDNTSPAAYAGIISGTGGITKNGTGTLILSGVNTYTGATTISAGVLIAGANVSVSTNGPFGNAATAIMLGDANTTTNNSSPSLLTGGAFTIARPVTIASQSTSGTYSIGGNTANTSVFSGAINMSQPLTISQVASGILTVGTGGIINGANLLTVAGAGNITISSVIGSGSGGLTMNGTGTLTLLGANTYSGATTVNGGVLKAGVATQAFGLTSAVTLANTSGVVLDITGFANTIGSLTGGGPNGGNVTLGAVTLTIGSDNTSPGTYAGIISGTGGIIKSGTGTLILSGADNYTGSTTINTGTLVLNTVTSFASSTTTVNSPGILELTSINTTVDNWRMNTILAGNGTINKTGIGWIQTFTNTHTFSGTFNVISGTFGTSYLSSVWTGITADFNVSAGALLDARGQAITVGSLNGLGNVGTTWNTAATVTTGAGNKSGSFSGIISGNGSSGTNIPSNPNSSILSLVKTGTGSQTLSGTNTYTGTTTVNGGTLKAGVATQAFGLTSAVTLANTSGVVLDITGYSNTIGSLTGGGSTGGNVTLGAATITIGSDNTSPAAYAGIISGTGGITKIGTGTLILSGANTYTGATTVNGGTLKAGVATQSFGLTSAVTLANTSGVVLDLTGFANTIGSLTGGGSTGGNVTLGAATLTIGSDNTSPAAYAGIISGTGGIIKSGTGTLNLSGANTYTGATTISAGTLMAGAAAPSGSAGAFGNAASAIILGDANTTTNNSSPSLLTGGAFTIARPVTIASQSTSGTYSIGGNTANTSVFSGTITLNEPLTISQVSSGIAQLSGTVTTGTNALNITGPGTVQRTTGSLSLGGAFNVSAGTFDANGQTNTVTGLTTVSGTGIYLAGSALQTFNGGLTISGGTVTGSTGGVTTTGLTLGSGTLTAPSGAFNVSGNWTNNGGTFTPGSNTVTFSGTGAQAINGTASGQTFNNVVVNMTSGQTLSVSGSTNSLTVGGTFTETLGNFTAPATMTITGNSTFTAGTFTTGTNLTETGNWTNNGGTFTAGSGTVTMNNGTTQSIGGTSSTTFNNLTISGGGIKTLTGAINVSGVLALTSGTLTTTSTNLLSITNTANTAISGGTVTSFINGPLKWSLPTISTAVTYNFPVGAGNTYLPFALVNPTTSGAATAQVQAFAANASGTYDATLSSLSKTEYWSLATAGNFTNTSVSVTRPLAITPLNTIGSCTTLGGIYTNLGGTAGTYGVTNSNPTTGPAMYFVLATGATGIITSVNTLTGFTYVSGSGPSSEQSFTVSGNSLTTNITITPPADFEISTGTGASFVPASQITLNVLNSTVTPTTIYVRMKAGLSMNPTVGPENIVLTSAGATTQNVACSGAVIVQPDITTTTTPPINPTSLSGFNYNFDPNKATASAVQSFSVSGNNLTGAIVITPPANYQLCKTYNGTFSSNAITLPPNVGLDSVAPTTIYVQLVAGLVVNTYSGNIVLTSPYAVTQNVFCSGSVTAPIVTVSTFNLAGFIYTSGSGPSASQFVSVSGTNLITNITVNAPDSFQISTDNTNWVLSIPLTQSGGSVTSTKIYVRLIAGLNPTLITPRNLTASSTGAITQNVICSGQVVNSATLISSVSALNGFMYLLGDLISPPQSFTLTGALLTNDITILIPNGFEISTNSGTSYSRNSLTITKPVSGNLNQLIFIRLDLGMGVNTYLGNLGFTSGTATVSIPCNGQVLTVPTLAVPTITVGGTPRSSVCDGDEPVTLSSTAIGGIANIIWAGPNGYYSQSATTPVPLAGGPVSPTDAGTYTVYGSVLSGVNLLTNGGFESGNVGFGSSYGYVVPSAGALEPEGLYTIVGDAPYLTPNNVHDNNGGFDDCGYHTGTHEMVINGASTAGVIVWSESVSVQTGIDYQFSYYIQSINAAAPSQLQLYVNGMPAGPVYTAPTSTCSWTQFIYNTNSDINTVLQLTLINQNTAANGNDFALDDIVFQQIFQVSSNVNLVVNPVLEPKLTVKPSSNPVFSGTTVTFTTTPTNGGTTPTYQWSVGGITVPGATGSTYTFIPTNGQIVSCTMNSSLPCATPSTASSSDTMTVNSRTNYWLGSIGVNGTDWGTATNWTAGTIPAPGNDVEYASTGNAANKNAVNSLQLDQDRTIGNLINATTQSLIIPAGKGLIVNQQISIVNGTTSQVYIHSDPVKANGSLIYHNPGTNPVNATVEMNSFGTYTSSGPANGKYTWQYFGIPIHSVVANPTFYNSYVRSYNEGSTVTNGKWTSLTNSSVLSSFTGYEITQTNPTTIQFQGTLENSNQPISLTYTSGAYDPGQNIISNSYTAAIDIRQLSFGPNTEQTIYLYNTGSFAQWGNNNGEGTNNTNPSLTMPGQYLAIPKNNAGTGNIPYDIPSMSGFLVRVSANDVLNIAYNNVATANVNPQRAPSQDIQTSNKIYMGISLKGKYTGDFMWLINQPGTTRGFDNGWDGYKLTGDAGTPQLFAMEESGNYQISTSDDMSNTYLGFQAGIDLEDTLTFYNENLTTKYAGVYLVDLVENIVTDITKSGTQYTFVTESTPTPVKRFMIATRIIEKDAPDANTQLKVFSSGHVVFVQNLGNLNGQMVVYDMMGHLLKRATFGSLGVTAIQLAAIPGAYVINAATSNERVSKRVILGE